MRKLRNCPFCGAEVNAEYPFLMHNEESGHFVLSHFCHQAELEGKLDICIAVYGKTEEEVIEKWNGRA